MKNFFDANVLVYAYTDSAKKQESRKLLAQGGVTDTLALAEAFGAIRRITKNHEYAQKTVRTIMGQLEVMDVTQETLFLAIKIKNLHITDAIHLVCSQGCNFITFDRDFDRHK